MLRDRLVCGVNDQRIQRRLLAEANLTFNKALQALEAAVKNAKELMPTKVAPIHIVRKPPTTGDCHRCGGKHAPSVCTFKDAECHNCGKKGHIARVCCSKAVKPSHPQERQRGGVKVQSAANPKKEHTARQHRERDSIQYYNRQPRHHLIHFSTRWEDQLLKLQYP